jgi:hypothetical protein
MSLSRRKVHALRSAGWTIIECPPWAELRRLLLRRRPVVQLPPVRVRWLP